MKHTLIWGEEMFNLMVGERVWFDKVMSSTSGIVQRVYTWSASVLMDNGHTMTFPIESLRKRT